MKKINKYYTKNDLVALLVKLHNQVDLSELCMDVIQIVEDYSLRLIKRYVPFFPKSIIDREITKQIDYIYKKIEDKYKIG